MARFQGQRCIAAHRVNALTEGVTIIAALRISSVCSVLFLLLSGQLTGQADAITGVVTDSATGGPVAGARIEAMGAGGVTAAVARTDFRGRFRLTGLAAQRYTIVSTRLGYAARRVGDIVPGTAQLVIAMVPVAVLDQVIVSASRVEQTALEAPASVSVVARREIDEATAFTPLDHVRSVTGIDFASKGLTQHTYAVRGGRGANSAVLLTLMDHRYAAIPSLRLNVPYLIPTTSDDIERIEVIRGPAAALYGPNSARGVVHIITRSPFESQGTSISLVGGERSLFQGSLRHAGVLGNRLGFKISGEYFRGNDWEFVDSVEARNRNLAIQKGADPDTLLVGKRDFGIERAVGQARLDWRPADNTSVMFTGGLAQAMNNIDLTAVGGTQVRDWRSQYLQAQVRHGRLFANVIYNTSNAGDTYQLRTGEPIVDNSRVLAAQLRHRTQVATRHDLLYGVDFRQTIPRTGGTIHGRNEDDDELNEIGAYVYSTTALSPKVDLVGALRLDYHDRINDLVLSPRAALVLKPSPSHAFRLTYNRAYNSPDPQDLFIDLVVDSFPGLPYGVRWRGTPKRGFNFRRDCGGLCMRSPFNPAGSQAFLLADATLMWTAVVAILQAQGVDISALPAPNATQVGTALRALNLSTGDFDQVTTADVADIEADRRTIRNVFELGYKGVIEGRILVGVDAYLTRVSDEFGELLAATPNVFLDQATLELYLGNFLPAAQAAQLADEITRIPLGTVSPEEAGDADVVLVQRQGSAYTLWGADFSITAEVTPQFSVRGTYSWTSRNSITNLSTRGNVILSVPKHKASVALGYRNDDVGFSTQVGARAVSTFPVASGVLRGQVTSYALLDASVRYRLPWAPNVRVSINAQNIFDNRHQEFAGAPELGRLLTTRLHVTF